MASPHDNGGEDEHTPPPAPTPIQAPSSYSNKNKRAASRDLPTPTRSYTPSRMPNIAEPGASVAMPQQPVFQAPIDSVAEHLKRASLNCIEEDNDVTPSKLPTPIMRISESGNIRGIIQIDHASRELCNFLREQCSEVLPFEEVVHRMQTALQRQPSNVEHALSLLAFMCQKVKIPLHWRAACVLVCARSCDVV